MTLLLIGYILPLLISFLFLKDSEDYFFFCFFPGLNILLSIPGVIAIIGALIWFVISGGGKSNHCPFGNHDFEVIHDTEHQKNKMRKAGIPIAASMCGHTRLKCKVCSEEKVEDWKAF